MAQANPELITEQISRDMNAIVKSGRLPDEVTLRRLRRDIGVVERKGAPEFASVMKSGLSLIERDFNAAYQQAEKTIADWPKSHWALLNIQFNLICLGRIVEPARNLIATILRPEHRDDAVLLKSGVHFSLSSGFISNVGELLSRIERLCPDAPPSELMLMLDTFKFHGVTDKHTTQIANAAYECLRIHDNGRFVGRSITLAHTYVKDDLGGEYFSNRVIIPELDDSDDEHVIQLNDALCITLADEAFLNNPALNLYLIDFILDEKKR